MADPTTTESTALAPAPGTAAAPTMGMAPRTLEEGWRLASMLAAGGDLVPKQFRDNPKAVIVAIQLGLEIGLPPMQALQSIAVIGGRPEVWGDGLLALIMSAPAYEDHEEYYEVEVVQTELIDGKKVERRVMERRDGLTPADLKVASTTAVCTFKRRGKPTPVTARFSVGQARTADYLSEKPNGGKDGPWRTHPDRMLRMRARKFAARDTFPDVLRGIAAAEERYSVEEITAAAPQVHRLSEAQLPAAPAAMDLDARPEPASPARAVAPDTIGPVRVTRVERLLGGPLAVLDDGSQVWLPSEDDAREVEKFIGTDHRLRFEIAQIEGVSEQWRATSFAIAD